MTIHILIQKIFQIVGLIRIRKGEKKRFRSRHSNKSLSSPLLSIFFFIIYYRRKCIDEKKTENNKNQPTLFV